ncbi:hypothetical protein B0675_39690 [Streptomyces sp. M41(2017)]|nr:hypothetical protein B0675_39690 [Streptomyces sp. M41(2017)]
MRAALVDAGINLLNMDADPSADGNDPGGAAVTADMTLGCILVRWEVHDRLAIAFEDEGGKEVRARYTAAQRAMHGALVTILGAYDFPITANRPGESIHVSTGQ